MDPFLHFFFQRVTSPLNDFGYWVNGFFPFSLSEIWIINGILAAIYSTYRIKKKRAVPLYCVFSVTLLMAQISAQGATPWGSSLGFYRDALPVLLNVQPIEKEDFIELIKRSQKSYIEHFSPLPLRSNTEWVTFFQKEISTALAELHLWGKVPKSLRVKPMQGFTLWAGLSYGGPAFNDPYTYEIAIARHKDYPTPYSWKVTAILHEMIHATGFARESDAEILTWWVLSQSSLLSLNTLSHQMILNKARIRYQMPESVFAEHLEISREFKEVRQRQLLIRYTRKFLKNIGIYNRAQKYGSVENPGQVEATNPFFSSVLELKKRIKKRQGNESFRESFRRL